jgi:hypothetical protein
VSATLEKKTTWRERHLGMLVAVPSVTALLILFNFIYVKIEEELPPEFADTLFSDTMFVDMEMPPVPPDPDPNKLALPPILTEVAATRAGSQEKGDQLVDPVKGETDATADVLFEEATPPSEPVPINEWVPTAREAVELQSIKEKVSDETRSLAERASKLRENIVRMEVVSAAKDFELNSDGGLEGAIRLLSIDGHDPATIKPLLEKYGISYERRYTKPVGGRGYLNAAATEKGTFRNVDKEGYYDVLVLSTRAVAYMASLETNALSARNYDPATTRIRKIVFGVVDNGRGELDLGVTDLQVEKIR